MPDHKGLEAVTERVEAKFMSRYIVPFLSFLLLIVSGYAFRAIMARLDGIDASNASQEKSITALGSDIRDINTRLDMGVIRQVSDNKAVIAEHEKRLQTLERAVNVK